MMAEIGMQTAFDHLTRLDDVNVVETWGEISFFYNPGNRLARGTYFATIKDKDGQGDNGSCLDRTEVWRLNLGVSAKTFADLFGAKPVRPKKGKVIEGPWDFGKLDTLTPHPVYGWMGWVAILNPSISSWQSCQSLIEDAHTRARITFAKRDRQLKPTSSNASSRLCFRSGVVCRTSACCDNP